MSALLWLQVGWGVDITVLFQGLNSLVRSYIGAAHWFSCLDPVFSLSSCAFEGTWVSSNGNRIKREPGLTRSECATECSNVGDCVAFTWWQSVDCDLYNQILEEKYWQELEKAFSVINERANYNCPSFTTTGTVRANPSEPLIFIFMFSFTTNISLRTL